jgi:hypothetical protein
LVNEQPLSELPLVIHRMSQFLFAPQVVLGGLNGRMAKQELNLFKFSPSQVA